MLSPAFLGAVSYKSGDAQDAKILQIVPLINVGSTNQFFTLDNPVDLAKTVIIATNQFTANASSSDASNSYQSAKLSFLDNTTVKLAKLFDYSRTAMVAFMIVEFPNAISVQYVESLIPDNQVSLVIPLPTTIDTTNNRILTFSTLATEDGVRAFHAGATTSATNTSVIVDRRAAPFEQSFAGVFVVELPPLTV